MPVSMQIACAQPRRAATGRVHAFRAALFGHKAVEAGAACLILMVQGNLAALTLAHAGVATKTGVLAVLPAVIVTFTRYARHLVNRWSAAAFLGVCTFAADAAVHASHYPGAYTEAVLTAIGAACFS